MTDTPSSRGSRAAPPVVNLGDPLPLADRADNRVLIPALEGAPPRPPTVDIHATLMAAAKEIDLAKRKTIG